MRTGKGRMRKSDVVVVTREREVITRREELRIGRDQERPDRFTLATWSENYEGQLKQSSHLFTVDRATLAKIRDAISSILDGGEQGAAAE